MYCRMKLNINFNIEVWHPVPWFYFYAVQQVLAQDRTQCHWCIEQLSSWSSSAPVYKLHGLHLRILSAAQSNRPDFLSWQNLCKIWTTHIIVQTIKWQVGNAGNVLKVSTHFLIPLISGFILYTYRLCMNYLT